MKNKTDKFPPPEETWEKENWKEASGINCSIHETNSLLASRDYSILCKAPSQNKITAVNGFWIWWCSTHYQPLPWCEIAKAKREESLKHCCCVIENSKIIESCKLHGDEIAKAKREVAGEMREIQCEPGEHDMVVFTGLYCKKCPQIWRDIRHNLTPTKGDNE